MAGGSLPRRRGIANTLAHPATRVAIGSLHTDPEEDHEMADLTKLESKLAEVLGLAMAAQRATRHVGGLLGDEHAELRSRLERMHDEASETEDRCTDVAGSFDGKKTAILESARETRDEGTQMMETYLGGEEDPLEGFEFLTMAEAGEVGHWSIVEKLNERAGNEQVGELVAWALPIQRRHFDEVLAGSLELAGDEDPDEIDD
jgi:hypothetical protein